jgi:hypothetical protein
MRPHTIGHVLNKCGPEIAASPLGGPFGHRMDGQIVVAVDPQRRDAET